MKFENSKLWSEIHEQDKCIENCLKINIPIIKQIVKEVEQRKIKNIVFAARGSSEHAAIIGKYLLEIYTPYFTSIASPSIVTCYDGNTNYHDTLVIGISQSGGAKDCYMVMEKCINDGGLCVSITNEKDSLMANIGHFRINNECGKEESITAAKSYITQLTLLFTFCAYLSKEAKLINFLNEIPDIVKYSYSFERDIAKIIPYFRNAQDIILFGRGLLYGVCEEAELKIQETSYVNARSYASSDYQHGPLAATNSFIPAIFFIADSLTDETIYSLHERLKKEYNIFSLVISNNDNYVNSGDLHIKLPDNYNGIKAVFSAVVISQMFACSLSIARGFNPDEPIGVSKHTVTI